jgi:hypothetical protein
LGKRTIEWMSDMVSAPPVSAKQCGKRGDSMTGFQFSEQEIEQLAQQVEQEVIQLNAESLSRGEMGVMRGIILKGAPDAPQVPQRVSDSVKQEIGDGDKAESLLEKFWEAFHQDLCLPGGNLNRQWEQLGEVEPRDMVQLAVAFLGGTALNVGITATVTNPHILAVFLSVWGLHAFANVGFRAICNSGQS